MSSKPSLWDLALKKNAESDRSTEEKTLIFVGNKGAGKSSIIQRFLDRNDVIKETLALEYSFGRKSGRSLNKEICHVWELGGGTLFIKLLELYIGKKNTTLVLVLDLSTPETLWNMLEAILTFVFNYCKKNDISYSASDSVENEYTTPFPIPLLIVGSKYDLFQEFDTEKKKEICRTLRSVAHSSLASLLFYSDRETSLIKKLLEVLHYHGFGSSQWKGHCSDYNKPLLICAGSDTYEEIGVNKSSLPARSKGLLLDYFKHTYTLAFPQTSESMNIPDDPAKDPCFREPLIDSLRAQKDEELEKFLREKEQRQKLAFDSAL